MSDMEWNFSKAKTAIHFYFRWFGDVLRAWGIAGATATLLGVVIAALAYFVPAWRDKMSGLSWEIPSVLFLAYGLYRFFRAPYRLYKEKQNDIDVLTGKIQECNHELIVVKASSIRAAAELTGIKEELHRAHASIEEHRKAIQRLSEYFPPDSLQRKCLELAKEIQKFLSDLGTKPPYVYRQQLDGSDMDLLEWHKANEPQLLYDHKLNSSFDFSLAHKVECVIKELAVQSIYDGQLSNALSRHEKEQADLLVMVDRLAYLSMMIEIGSSQLQGNRSDLRYRANTLSRELLVYLKKNGPDPAEQVQLDIANPDKDKAIDEYFRKVVGVSFPHTEKLVFGLDAHFSDRIQKMRSELREQGIQDSELDRLVDSPHGYGLGEIIGISRRLMHISAEMEIGEI